MKLPNASRLPAVTKRHVPIRLSLCCALGIFCAKPPQSWAQEDGSAEVIAADIIIVRPICLVATVVGSALFVLALPIALATKDTHEIGRKLVALPARATFSRRLGDMSSLTNP